MLDGVVGIKKALSESFCAGAKAIMESEAAAADDIDTTTTAATEKTIIID